MSEKKVGKARRVLRFPRVSLWLNYPMTVGTMFVRDVLKQSLRGHVLTIGWVGIAVFWREKGEQTF